MVKSGWDYMDCVHDGQELAPTVSDVDASNGDIMGCGLRPSGNDWVMIITVTVSSVIALCCICCIGCKCYNKYKVKKQIKKLNKFEILDDEEIINDTNEGDNNNKKAKEHVDKPTEEGETNKETLIDGDSELR